MKLTMTLIVSAATAAGLLASPAFAKKAPNLVKACKKECPEAKTDDEAHACADALEKGDNGKAFKKSHCYKTDEAWEKATGKEENEGHEHSEQGETH